ncbi:4'-phosphopantetheinyl transferase family protein [Petropleomorpha daqingensis]|uniref:4'-phosphopantetheinyl transferase n=1 Tax=Petropleomorpha daqingensis TaxID=2026353 RepID=A0A853CM96_9ACTN|nr:4-phosphopantetheinyl transferase [Petropleomorpha daqingensis]NYJ07939.1 4'-phosphopantetheinyl transferase [Petropleomorpha daqingensis]
MSTCQVWWARTSDASPALDGLLAADDLARRARLRQDGDRRRTTVATAVARSLLGTALGVAPAEVPIDRTCPECGAPHGKPRVAGGPQFSVSHADDVVVVAVHAARAVGVDVEAVARCTPDLAAVLPGHAAGPEALARAWVRAEAVAKATGQGLGGEAAPARVALVDLPAPAGFAAALAVLGSGPVRVHTHDAAGLLAQSSRRLPSATTRSHR